MSIPEPTSGNHVIRPSEIGWVMEPRTGNPSEGILSIIFNERGEVVGDIARTNEGMRTNRAAVQFDESFISMQSLSGVVDVINDAITKLTMKGCSLFSLEVELTPLLQPKLILTGVDSNGFVSGAENSIDSLVKGGNIA